MFTKQLNDYKIKYGIRSADQWASTTEASKSTISRALNGTAKDMTVGTLLEMVKPYGNSLDEVLGLGIFSPEAIEKESIKGGIVEKIETVIEAIENSVEIPEQPTVEIKSALEEVHEYITNEPSESHKCIACSMYEKTIAELQLDKSTKDKWLFRLFRMNFIMLGILFAMIVVASALSICLFNAMH